MQISFFNHRTHFGASPQNPPEGYRRATKAEIEELHQQMPAGRVRDVVEGALNASGGKRIADFYLEKNPSANTPILWQGGEFTDLSGKRLATLDHDPWTLEDREP